MKTGRNERCPCGSGRKWKKCCALVAPPVVATPVEPAPADAVTTAPPEPPPPGGRDWVPLQHQAERLRPNNFGRKKGY